MDKSAILGRMQLVFVWGKTITDRLGIRNGCRFRTSLTNGTQKKILDLASLDGIGKHSKGTSIGSEINFCTDYIAIETCYETGLEDFPKENRSLLIFDYHGNLISENEL
ncbi:MAG: hypothetical protein SOR93_19130 [Clostridiales Family XIII bacterium]|uniref:hypothetical protein n=1 Tax=Hominibacterium faecale TaxID=2839743 RepID=UPI0022B29B36|nr:hypothetical protein [Hominibacterium faecale]MCI7304489.1 hypothetical protein [Clostridia bacterium]MDY3013357.1 hypothetical protein [Clostridiales Family XIII bacterium]